MGLLIHGPLGIAPKGLQDSAQGCFNPGNPQSKWFALKGRELRLPDESRTLLRRKNKSAQLKHVAIGHYNPPSALLVRSIWRPFRAHCSGGRFPGLKPWAESSRPFGAKIFPT
jgi:hypothetical protein